MCTIIDFSFTTVVQGISYETAVWKTGFCQCTFWMEQTCPVWGFDNMDINTSLFVYNYRYMQDYVKWKDHYKTYNWYEKKKKMQIEFQETPLSLHTNIHFPNPVVNGLLVMKMD